MSSEVTSSRAPFVAFFLSKFFYFLVIFVAVMAFLEWKGEPMDGQFIFAMICYLGVSLILTVVGLYLFQKAMIYVGRTMNQESYYSNLPVYIIAPVYLAILYLGFHFGWSIIKSVIIPIVAR